MKDALKIIYASPGRIAVIAVLQFGWCASSIGLSWLMSNVAVGAGETFLLEFGGVGASWWLTDRLQNRIALRDSKKGYDKAVIALAQKAKAARQRGKARELLRKEIDLDVDLHLREGRDITSTTLIGIMRSLISLVGSVVLLAFQAPGGLWGAVSFLPSPALLVGGLAGAGFIMRNDGRDIDRWKRAREDLKKTLLDYALNQTTLEEVEAALNAESELWAQIKGNSIKSSSAVVLGTMFSVGYAVWRGMASPELLHVGTALGFFAVGSLASLQNFFPLLQRMRTEAYLAVQTKFRREMGNDRTLERSAKEQAQQRVVAKRLEPETHSLETNAVDGGPSIEIEGIQVWNTADNRGAQSPLYRRDPRPRIYAEFAAGKVTAVIGDEADCEAIAAVIAGEFSYKNGWLTFDGLAPDDPSLAVERTLTDTNPLPNVASLLREKGVCEDTEVAMLSAVQLHPSQIADLQANFDEWYKWLSPDAKEALKKGLPLHPSQSRVKAFVHSASNMNPEWTAAFTKALRILADRDGVTVVVAAPDASSVVGKADQFVMSVVGCITDSGPTSQLVPPKEHEVRSPGQSWGRRHLSEADIADLNTRPLLPVAAAPKVPQTSGEHSGWHAFVDNCRKHSVSANARASTPPHLWILTEVASAINVTPEHCVLTRGDAASIRRAIEQLVPGVHPRKLDRFEMYVAQNGCLPPEFVIPPPFKRQALPEVYFARYDESRGGSGHAGEAMKVHRDPQTEMAEAAARLRELQERQVAELVEKGDLAGAMDLSEAHARARQVLEDAERRVRDAERRELKAETRARLVSTDPFLDR